LGPSARSSTSPGWASDSAAHEQRLARAFLDAVAGIPAVRIVGISDPDRISGRVPTFSFLVGRHSPDSIAAAFADRNFFIWSGSFYAHEAAGALGVHDSGGVARLGFAHYNTLDEVMAIAAVLQQLAART
jgi:selenocysteine lyase/cysteine desulfurase